MQHVCACYRREESEKPDEFETFGTPLTPIVVEHPGQFDEEMFGAILGSTLAEDIATRSQSRTTVHRFDPSHRVVSSQVSYNSIVI